MSLLILRFSSIGDVVLCIPLILRFKETYPNVKLAMAAPAMYRSLIEPLGVQFIATDLKGKHKGFSGLWKLYRQLIKEIKPNMVVDLHSVLRTHVLRGFFRLFGTPFFGIDKGRAEKKALTRKDNKKLKALTHTTLRYARVFADAGYPLDFDPAHPPLPSYESPKAEELASQHSGKKLIGLAPLAAFEGKTFPKEKVKALIHELLAMDYKVFLFGGPSDLEYLEELKSKREQVIVMAGDLKFAEEIVFMRHLNAMISMDSANMHLATMAGIPVISIWGATHAYAGFSALGANDQYQVGISTESLDCRPCSVFGNKPCFRKDYACLNQLETLEVVQALNKAVN